jgi:hypothetical protein
MGVFPSAYGIKPRIKRQYSAMVPQIKNAFLRELKKYHIVTVTIVTILTRIVLEASKVWFKLALFDTFCYGQLLYYKVPSVLNRLTYIVRLP